MGGKLTGQIAQLSYEIMPLTGALDKIPDIDDVLYLHAKQIILPDNAMKTIPGGIDLDKINLKIQNNDGEIKFQWAPAMLAQLQNIPGFIPKIVGITPLKSLSKFMETPS